MWRLIKKNGDKEEVICESEDLSCCKLTKLEKKSHDPYHVYDIIEITK